MKINTCAIVVTGNVTKDAELRYSAKQSAVLSFTVACNRRGLDGQQAVDYFPVSLWGKSAESLEQYIKKGKFVLVKGRLTTGSYTNRDGIKVNTIEITADSYGGVELLGGGSDERHGHGYGDQHTDTRQYARDDRPPAPRSQQEDDLPPF